MSTFSPDAIRRMRSMPISTNFYFHEHRKPDLRKVGKDIYELLTGTGSRGYKQRARKQAVQFKADDTMYEPKQVSNVFHRCDLLVNCWFVSASAPSSPP